jgi:hypothetical protein
MVSDDVASCKLEDRDSLTTLYELEDLAENHPPTPMWVWWVGVRISSSTALCLLRLPTEPPDPLPPSLSSSHRHGFPDLCAISVVVSVAFSVEARRWWGVRVWMKRMHIDPAEACVCVGRLNPRRIPFFFSF